MDDFKGYLADKVLSEEGIVTYRGLSRALKVNVNVAKQMLYAFHKAENKKKAGSVHATYMIYGTVLVAEKTNGHSQDNGDVEMASSPPAESLAEEVAMLTLSLVDESQLKDKLAEYESVNSIHVHSLASFPFKDMQLLTDATQPRSGEIYKPTVPYLGAIRNSHVRRRERKGPPPPAVAAAAAAKPVIKTEAAAASKAPATGKEPLPKATTPDIKPKIETLPGPALAPVATSVPAKKPVPSLKRGGSSGIMQSFAKAASQPKKPPVAAKKAVAEPAMSDDGEDDEDDALASATAQASKASAAKGEVKVEKENDGVRKARQEREERLKRMMEEDEEGDNEKEDDDDEMNEQEEEDATEPEPEPEPAPIEPTKREPAEVIASASNGRRRGRRRVEKKKTFEDADGCIAVEVVEEWESFSEDEPVAAPPKKAKLEVSTPASASASASEPAKAKKPAAKGQGNIMSFFGKK